VKKLAPVRLIVALAISLLLLSTCGDNNKPAGTETPGQWTQRESGTSEHLNSVAWNGALFVAVGWSVILTSPDGITWDQQQMPPEYASMPGLVLKSVVWSEPLQLFLVAGDDNALMTSPDGLSWTSRQSGLDWGFISCAAAFDTLLLVSFYNPIALITSGDGVSWTRYDLIRPFDKMAAWDTLIVGVGGGEIHTSRNGADWTLRHDGDSLVHCVTWFDEASLWIAAGHLGYFLTSADGVNWAGINAGAGEISTLRDAASLGSHCVIVGTANGPGLAMTTTDAVTWTRSEIDSVGWLNGVTASPARWVAVGENGVILTLPH